MQISHILIFKLCLAMLIGAVIGVERELRSKSAGFRTLILISLGATLFTIFSQVLGALGHNEDRIASNVVVGIGFLGAGVIFKGENGVNGITTAATIWLTAALGVGVGCGYYMASILGCLFVLVTLIVLSKLDYYIDKLNQVRYYIIEYTYEDNNQHKYEALFREYRLTVKTTNQKKSGNRIRGTWMVIGKESKHHAFIEKILEDKTITDFEF
jgi:putative Mg2+ transporter-C (MgtC) family protein